MLSENYVIRYPPYIFDIVCYVVQSEIPSSMDESWHCSSGTWKISGIAKGGT